MLMHHCCRAGYGAHMEIRNVEVGDVEAILALWHIAGSGHDLATDRLEIETKLDHDPDLFLLGSDDDGQIVASVMGTYDGHRGRIKRAVVHPGHQRTGLGRALLAELDRRFRDRGIVELRLEVWSSNDGAKQFWESLGWQHEPDILYFTRSLDS